MNDLPASDDYAMLTDPATLTIRRLLPGPAERVWRYLTESELRAKWLASGVMEPRAGTAVEFVWRNDELGGPPARRPEGAGEEHRRQLRVTGFDPPRRLAMSWEEAGEVVFTLEPRGDDVLLTLVHSRIPDRDMLLGVSPGWHVHLDLLAAALTGAETEPFWDGWTRLRAEYEQRLPA